MANPKNLPPEALAAQLADHMPELLEANRAAAGLFAELFLSREDDDEAEPTEAVEEELRCAFLALSRVPRTIYRLAAKSKPSLPPGMTPGTVEFALPESELLRTGASNRATLTLSPDSGHYSLSCPALDDHTAVWLYVSDGQGFESAVEMVRDDGALHCTVSNEAGLASNMSTILRAAKAEAGHAVAILVPTGPDDAKP